VTQAVTDRHSGRDSGRALWCGRILDTGDIAAHIAAREARSKARSEARPGLGGSVVSLASGGLSGHAPCAPPLTRVTRRRRRRRYEEAK
jgi:hypothetical protein